MKLRRVFVTAAVMIVGAAAGCDTMRSHPPPLGGPVGEPTEADAGGSAASSVESTPPDLTHMMTISVCARDADTCKNAQGAGEDPTLGYRVAYRTGAGMLRTRDQAMADIYKELRDRINGGSRLVAQSHHLAEAPDAQAGFANPRHGANRSEPVVGAAFELMDMVDAEGEVTVDTVAGAAGRTCKLSVGGLAWDGGTGHCLLEEEEVRHERNR